MLIEKNAFEVLNTGQAKLAKYETTSGRLFPQSLSADFTFITAGSASGDLNQLTAAEATALPTYITPNTRTLSDGDGINLPATIGNLELLSWTGAAGSAELRLPSLLPTNRAITFVIDSSFATNLVRIKFSGATLATLQYSDVSASVFRAATLWYDGTSYYVISNTVVNP